MSKSNALIARQGKGPTAQVNITPAGLTVIERMFAEGQDYRTVAKALGCSGKSLQEARKRDPAVADAWERGLAALADEVTHLLLKAARKGNIVAAIFLAKTRLGWRETGPTPDGPRVAVQINLPGAMDERAYTKIIEGADDGEGD